MANFDDDFQTIRRFAERDHANIVSLAPTTTRAATSPPHDAPDLLLADLREFYRPLR